jgi:DHA2 family multidrug resistance protein
MTDRHPAVDLMMFRRRNFTLGTIAFCLGYAVFFANVLLMPLWMQTQLGYTATWAGLVAAPSGVVAVVLTPFVARLSGRVDARIMATIAFVAFAVSFFMRSHFTTNDDIWTYTMPLLVQGVAMSTFFVAMLTIQLDGIPPERIPSATGISNFARITSGSFAASLITTMWDRREALHQSRLADHFTIFQPRYQGAIEQLQAIGASARQAAGAITHQMVQQAYLLAADDLFWLSGWISLAMIALIWFARRPAGSAAHVAAD